MLIHVFIILEKIHSNNFKRKRCIRPGSSQVLPLKRPPPARPLPRQPLQLWLGGKSMQGATLFSFLFWFFFPGYARFIKPWTSLCQETHAQPGRGGTDVSDAQPFGMVPSASGWPGPSGWRAACRDGWPSFHLLGHEDASLVTVLSYQHLRPHETGIVPDP